MMRGVLLVFKKLKTLSFKRDFINNRGFLHFEI